MEWLTNSDGSKIQPDFVPLLVGLDADELATAGDVVCGVFANDWTLGYVNTGWLAFANANGGNMEWTSGVSLLDEVSEPLRTFYRDKLTNVLRYGEPWEHDYECSGAGVHRDFRMRALRVAHGRGLLLSHSLRLERPHHDVAHPWICQRYQTDNGLVTQCSHCRRVRRADNPRSWDWVPALLENRVDGLTHGLCELCSAYYFGNHGRRH